jgi:isoquinoline 1-oxidoreductase beta subunit
VEGEVARADGDIVAARAGADQVVEAEYFQPFLAHSTMEPMNATIALEKDSALLIASLQSPAAASRLISKLTGINRLNIDVRLPRSGGGFGRRGQNDFVAEAVHIAKAVHKPVKLIWTREDDLRNDWYRPSGAHGMTATLDSRKQLTGWTHKVAATDRRFRIPYRITWPLSPLFLSVDRSVGGAGRCQRLSRSPIKDSWTKLRTLRVLIQSNSACAYSARPAS